MEIVEADKIDVREIALKWTIKDEVNMVLTITGKFYLPPIQQVNWDFISDLLRGDIKNVHPFSDYFSLCMEMT